MYMFIPVSLNKIYSFIKYFENVCYVPGTGIKKNGDRPCCQGIYNLGVKRAIKY